ncbi:MAG: hypothetical protein QOE92_1512 [Chloroflexota bacterium]|jgi:predicted ATPase/class 3 adenylate cyclase|nr:hypothetical protein [Chloroflexota bacterium]
MPLSAAGDLPTGTATFLFTDIQGSTALVQQLGIERWKDVLDTHYALLREQFSANGGVEVNTEGDAFFVAFSQATQAVAACAAGQRALHEHDWPPDAVVRVRMGLHTGEAALVGGDYMGLDIHRAARVASSAHGGQVVLSDVTRALVEDALPDGVGLIDLGEHRLKDLARPERIWQLRIDGLPDSFPPIKSLDSTPNNLPTQLTSFVGRDKELAEARTLLQGARLLTLTGPGGTGKTRLSLQLAAEVADDFKHGVYFVPLAPVSDPDLVGTAIADVLSIREFGNRPPLDLVVESLKDKQTLLVLDNFEQVTEAAPGVNRILKEAPDVKVVVSSRSPLKIYGEQEFPIPPLGLPDPNALGSVEALSQFEAVRLFIERAVSVKPNFAVTNENAPAVAGICALVDGLPLAIELAAARIRLFSPEAMLKRLETSLADLGGGARDLPARQQTLRGAIQWSYELLDRQVAHLMDTFSVFVGGATLEHAEAVIGALDPELDVLAGLEALLDQSMVRIIEGTGGEPRFLMLHIIREFALERLSEAGDSDRVRDRHAEVFLELVEAAAPQLTGPNEAAALDGIATEHDNIRASLVWLMQHKDTAEAMRLAAGMWRYWQRRGPLVEGRERIDAVLALPGGDEHPLERMALLEAAGGVAWWQGLPNESASYYEDALVIARAHGTQADVARQLYNASFPLLGGDPDKRARGVEVAREAYELYKGMGDRLGEARAMWAIGGHYATERQFEESLKWNDPAVEIMREVGEPFDVAWVLHSDGLGALNVGQFDRAHSSLAESLGILVAAGDSSGLTILLGDYADLARAEEDIDRAFRLRGAAAAIQDLTGSALEDLMQTAWQSYRLEHPMDNERARRLFRQGQTFTSQQAVAYALGEWQPEPVPEEEPAAGTEAATTGSA